MSKVYENDGYMMLLDAVYFSSKRFGNISEEGLTWEGEDAQITELWAAQSRSAAVKEIMTKNATDQITGKLIELVPENCVSLMGGKVTDDKWEAPANSVILEGPLKILCGTGQTIDIKRASLRSVIRGGLGGENTLGIQFTLKVLTPKDGSSPLSIYPTDPFIKANPTSLTFEVAGGSKTLDIEASGPFSVGAVPDGFSVQIVNGRVTVTAQNNASGQERSGQLEFILEADPEKKATVSLSQPNA